MKKTIILGIICSVSMLLCACDDNSSSKDDKESTLQTDTTSITTTETSMVSEDTGSDTSEEDDTSNSTAESTVTTTKRTSHQEYIYNYTAYAEGEAIVTYCEPQSGRTKFKTKCSYCGWVSPSERIINSGGGGGESSSFLCSAGTRCPHYGKPLYYKIVIEDHGYWTDVYD